MKWLVAGLCLASLVLLVWVCYEVYLYFKYEDQ